MLAVTLTQVVQDVTQRGRHLSGQVDAGVVTGQHLHQLWQQLIRFGTTNKRYIENKPNFLKV